MRINALGNTATDFASDDYIAIDGTTNGSRKIKNDDLQKVTAQKALAENVAPEFIPNDTNAVAGMPYVYGGKLYIAKEDYSGVWNPSKFNQTSIEELLNKSSNFNGNSKSFSAISGELVEFGINVSLSQGEMVYVLVTGDSGVVLLDRFNVKFYIGGAYAGIVSSSVTQLDKWFEVTAPVNADKITMQRDSAATSGNLTAFFVPERALLKYVKSLIADNYQSLSNDIGTANGRIDTLDSEVDTLDVAVNGRTTYHDYDISGAQTGYYYNNSGTAVYNGESSYCTITFDNTDVGKSIVIRVNESTGNTDARCYVLCDENDVVKQYIRNQDIIYAGGTWTFHTAVGASGWKLKCSWKTATGSPSIGYVLNVVPSLQEKVEGYVKYVSTTGNDSNEGSISSPLKTISKAVELGAETVIVAAGVYEDNNINLSKSKHDNITVKGEIGEKVVFKKANSKLVDSGAETLVSGYSKVYSVTCIDTGYTGTNQWLFFDGLADLSQPITKQNAHPLERGLFYRNDCTKIVRTTADTLASALDEIEACSANVYKWFYDSGTLYFNRSASTSTYPIYRSNGSYLTTRNNQSVELSNIEFRYGSVNLTKINVAELYNVACKYVYADGCFVFVDCLSILFDHCEASSCFRNVNGDGFNGWSNVPSDYSARRETTILRNCWSHDNLDDGYSDHRYSEMSVEGGLFEYNGKGGITPSYGSHCTISNAVARMNRQNGFYYTGTANDNGNGGQMICFCCLSDSNNTSNGASAAGYRCDGNGNRAILVGCKAINEIKAFRCDTDAFLDLIDCGAANISGDVVSGAGTIVKVSTTIVS